jgi:hypothetical protein
MVRISKQAEKRSVSPRRTRFPSPKTGPLKDNLANGFKEHVNCYKNENNTAIFIGKFK